MYSNIPASDSYIFFDGVWPMACADRGRGRPDVESQMVAFSFHLAGPVVVLG